MVKSTPSPEQSIVGQTRKIEFFLSVGGWDSYKLFAWNEQGSIQPLGRTKIQNKEYLSNYIKACKTPRLV